jgi:hypothetical protein
MPDRDSDRTDPRWRPRVRLPHRSGPIRRTGYEIAGVFALLAAVLFLAFVAVAVRRSDLFLVFAAFGIPDLLFAWFRWRRFRLPARWSTDLRATILLTGLTVYLGVSAVTKVNRPVLLVAVALSGFAAVIWIVEVIRERLR